MNAVCTWFFAIVLILQVLEDPKYLFLAAETEAILIFRNFADVVVFADFLVLEFHQKASFLIEGILYYFLFDKVVLFGGVIWVDETQIVKACA